MKLKDLTGKIFHELAVLKRAGSNRQGSSTWLCLCSCGNEKVYSSDHLTRSKGSVKSCGCKAIRTGPRHSHNFMKRTYSQEYFIEMCNL